MVSLYPSASICVPLHVTLNFGKERKRMKFGLACKNVVLDSFRHVRLQCEEETAETFMVVSNGVSKWGKKLFVLITCPKLSWKLRDAQYRIMRQMPSYERLERRCLPEISKTWVSHLFRIRPDLIRRATHVSALENLKKPMAVLNTRSKVCMKLGCGKRWFC